MIIKVFYLYAPIVFWLLAAIPACLVQIDEAKQAEIIEETEKRYNDEPAYDPLTGQTLPSLPSPAE
eukprot:1594328-Prymnesium_polylepis.1